MSKSAVKFRLQNKVESGEALGQLADFIDIGVNYPTNCEMLHFPMPGMVPVIYYRADVQTCTSAV
jgi:hypothetical protein